MTEQMSDVDTVISLLERAVSERGADFNYGEWVGIELSPDSAGEGCQYVHYVDSDGEVEEEPTTRSKAVPGCIAGFALHLHGVKLSDLRELEGNQAHDAARNVTYLSDDARQVLQSAQAAQDQGKSWGEALESARVRAAELNRRVA